MSVLVDLATRIQSEGVATIGTDLFHGVLPDTPNTCIALQEYPGPNSRLQGPNEVPMDERHAVQVLVRSESYPTAESKAEAAWLAVPFRHEEINGRRYAWSVAPAHPAYMGPDENGRHRLVFNVQVRRHRESGFT